MIHEDARLRWQNKWIPVPVQPEVIGRDYSQFSHKSIFQANQKKIENNCCQIEDILVSAEKAYSDFNCYCHEIVSTKNKKQH